MLQINPQNESVKPILWLRIAKKDLNLIQSFKKLPNLDLAVTFMPQLHSYFTIPKLSIISSNQLDCPSHLTVRANIRQPFIGQWFWPFQQLYLKNWRSLRVLWCPPRKIFFIHVYPHFDPREDFGHFLTFEKKKFKKIFYGSTKRVRLYPNGLKIMPQVMLSAQNWNFEKKIFFENFAQWALKIKYVRKWPCACIAIFLKRSG